jgi:hypothetical protein
MSTDDKPNFLHKTGLLRELKFGTSFIDKLKLKITENLFVVVESTTSAEVQ